MDFESPDDIDRSYKRQSGHRKSESFEVQSPKKLPPRPEEVNFT